MNSTSFRYTWFMLCLFVFIGSSQQVKCSDNWNFSNAVFGVGAALAAIGAGAGYYLYGQTDEQACTAAENALQKTKVYVSPIENFCSLHNVTSPDDTAYPNEFDENYEFASLAYTFLTNNMRSKAYFDELYEVVSALQYSKKNLLNRIEKLAQQQHVPDTFTKMQALYKRIKQILPYIELYYKFLYEHRAYFTLYEFTHKIEVRYKQESIAVAQYTYDPAYLAYAIKQTVGTHTDLRGKYRLLAYKNMLDDDIQNMSHHIQALRFSYPLAYDRAIQWQDFVKRIRGIILADPDYQYQCELRDAIDDYRGEVDLEGRRN